MRENKLWKTIYFSCAALALLLALQGGRFTLRAAAWDVRDLTGVKLTEAQTSPLDLEEIRAVFSAAIRQGEYEIVFMAPESYTMEQITQQLSKAALEQKRLYTGKCTYRKQADAGLSHYTFWLDEDSLPQVEPLKDTKAAYRAALEALQHCDYTTRFYSEKSYYAIFYLMLQQHPEYNYETVVWKNDNGTYGYRRSSELTKREQDAKMLAAEQKAEAFVKDSLRSSMTTTQKLKAIHDHLVTLCRYDRSLENVNGYEDSLTAYGALVKKKAVCQGYTAAFNLIGQKAGIDSIAVCGTAGGEKHTWNYVKVVSGGRYIDCTWDDTLQTGSGICYDYFMVSKSVMKKSHAWDEKKYTRKHLSYCKYL